MTDRKKLTERVTVCLDEDDVRDLALVVREYGERHNGRLRRSGRTSARLAPQQTLPRQAAKGGGMPGTSAYREAGVGWSQSGHIVISGQSTPIPFPRAQGWGDYQGMAGVDPTSAWFGGGSGAFFSVWTDTLNGVSVIHGAHAGISP